MMLRLLAFVIFALFALSAMGAEEATLLSKFAGEWRSDGDAFGKRAESRMTWRVVLDDRFYRLDYKVTMHNDSEEPSVFQGVAYYQVSDQDGLAAYWADNSGDLHPIRASRDGDALVANWGVEGGKQGRTRYELLSADEMEVTDWIRTPGEWRQFNRNIFTRAAN